MRIVLTLVLALALAGCSSGLNRPVQEVVARTGDDGVQHVEIIAHSYWFEPNRVVVTAGHPVELTVRNAAVFVPHNLSCNAADAGLLIDADLSMFRGRKTVRFTPTTAGEYRFSCHVDAHAKKGMTGTIVVRP